MFNPHLKDQNQRMTYKDIVNRKDEFPHPKRRCVFHITGNALKPVIKVAYEDKAEADLWRDDHIDKLLETGEWFLSQQEADEAKLSRVQKARDEHAEITEKLKKKTG